MNTAGHQGIWRRSGGRLVCMMIINRIAWTVVFGIDISGYAGYRERSDVWLTPAVCE
jgi:hypothetical protein